MSTSTDPSEYKTFHDLLSDPDMDPFGTEGHKEGVHAFMEEWRPNNNPRDPADTLVFVRETFADGRMGGILVFSCESGSPRLHVLMGLQNYGITVKNRTSPPRPIASS